jgi:excisionase family DNA binding protein
MVTEDSLSVMLTIGEVADMLHVHSNTIRRWSNQGYISSYRLGNRGDRRFKPEDISSFLEETHENGDGNGHGNVGNE